MAAPWGLAFALCLLCSTTFPIPSIGTSVVSSSASNDGSVLEALLESQYSEWMELVERAQMLHPLEQLVGSGEKLTIFAPQNHQLNPQVKLFVLKPSNAHLLKRMVQFHVLSQRVTFSQWRDTSMTSLAGDSVSLRSETHNGFGSTSVKMYVGEAEVVAPDVILRADGVVHGVDQMLLPMSVQQEYVAFSTRHLAVLLPTGAPVMDTRRALTAGTTKVSSTTVSTIVKPKPILPISPVAAPSPFSAPAPGPSLGPSGSPFFGVSTTLGEVEVTTFITALKRFGGYEEFVTLVDMTTLGWEISKLVNEGYKLTILAPDDKAWKNSLTSEQLSTELEHILHYHVITEYQTEESLYSTLRRHGKMKFSTLRVPLKVSAQEIDGQVVFEEGKIQAGVYDHDIYTDGRISVQGIDKVLIPSAVPTPPASENKHRTRSVLEMLQLPSRASISRNEGSRRVATGASTIPAAAALLVLLVMNFLV